MNKSSREVWEGYVLLLFIFVTFMIPGHLANWWVEKAYSLALMMFSLIFLVSGIQVGFYFVIILISYSVLFLITITQIIIGYSIEYSFGDYLELLRYFIYSSGLILILKIKNNVDLDGVLLIVKFFTSYSLACFLILYFDIPVLSYIVDMLYSNTKTTIEGGWIRLSIPYENPNYLGLAAACSLLAFLVSYEKAKSSLMWVIFSVVLVYASGSRTAMLIAVVFVFFWCFRNSKVIFLKSYFYLFLLVVTLTLFQLSDAIFSSSRVQMIINIFQNGLDSDRNFMARIDMILVALDDMGGGYVFGKGSNKSLGMNVIDSQYFIIFYRSGLIGLIFWLIGMFMLMVYITSGNKYKAYSWLIICGLSISFITGAFFNNFRLWMSLLILLVFVAKIEQLPKAVGFSK